MGSFLLLIGAGFLAGSMNAVAGGGSFVSLPALILAGLPSTVANASSTVALLPGTLASAWAYREDARPLPGVRIGLFLLISIAGGLVGAVLLLSTTAREFDGIVPWLLLVATLAFAFGGRVGAALRRRVHIGQGALLAIQAVLAVYGGYFGGGVGIMMLAAWGLMIQADLRALNPVRTVMVTACNAAAVVLFVVAGAVRWPETLATLAGALVGGYVGARVARRLPQPVLRGVIIAIAVTMTVVFFVRAA
jgi:uncharacterized membrane protein YfcA